MEALGRRGLLFVISSPSGAGKTAITRALLAGDNELTVSISMTTRRARPGEVDGVDYIFIDEVDFSRHVAVGEFLEHAVVFGNSYGTPRAPVEEALESGRDVLFDVDWQGAQQIAQHAREDLVSVFVLPPSMAELEHRLETRAQDSRKVVAARMAQATNEISHWAEYDYVIINDDLDRSIAEVTSILKAERLRRRRRTGLVPFVRSLCGND